MASNKGVQYRLWVRVGALAITLLTQYHLVYQGNSWITVLILLGLTAIQVVSLVQYLDRNTREVLDFLHSLKMDEVNAPFSTDDKDPTRQELYTAFNEVLAMVKEVRTARDEQYQYLKNIVHHVGIGLITFDARGDVQIVNTAARKLFGRSELRNIRELEMLNPALVESLRRLKTGGRDLVRLEREGDVEQLSVYAIELTLRGKEFKLVSVQNIRSELEEKEMEAWQNLIRVLTHEIMNSVTPISSLAGTVRGELEGQLTNDLEVNPIPNDEIEDLFQAVDTIQRRSEGLIRFVQDFRNLTHIPQPNKTRIEVRELLQPTVMLLQPEAEAKGVNLSLSVDPETLSVMADSELIDQVLINLVKNAIQAFDEDHEGVKEVALTATEDSRGRVLVHIKDNGVGIEEDALSKIFIPFFTTKKQGSGIGLSLSRQIMRQHGGNISVKSVVNEGTEFTLKI
ncbi:MAG TPA: ATP-binding protein [Cytophagales bacterium]|nr:ATP-binding protein [Cytophagales bacterium]